MYTQAGLSQFEGLVDEQILASLYDKARALRGKNILVVNSTRKGGGVAELLETSISLLRELGINAEWLTLNAPEEFFAHTKEMFRTLQGMPPSNGTSYLEQYSNFYNSDEFSELNAELITNLRNFDIVYVHDHQPLPLINLRNGVPWVWRCHLAVDETDMSTWNAIYHLIQKYDGVIVSLDSYKREGNWHVVPPSIDPFSAKNKELSQKTIDEKLLEYGVKTDLPLVVQVSRFDKLKDPEGVVSAFQHLRNEGIEARLVLVGSRAVDDPEGNIVYESVRAMRDSGPYPQGICLILNEDPLLVNALQRSAAVVVQNSLKEAFGLTVTEAMYKEKAVVGRDVSGLNAQISHGHNGYLVKPYLLPDDSARQTASYLRGIIEDKALARRMGQNAKDQVLKMYLSPHQLLQELRVLSRVSETYARQH